MNLKEHGVKPSNYQADSQRRENVKKDYRELSEENWSQIDNKPEWVKLPPSTSQEWPKKRVAKRNRENQERRDKQVSALLTYLGVFMLINNKSRRGKREHALALNRSEHLAETNPYGLTLDVLQSN